jgi:enoyl-CoA hydratase/carnithine racemase
MPGDTTTVRRRVEGPVGRIELTRPEKLNALDRATLEGLAEAAQWFDTQPGVKVVVVCAEGPSFSAGFDLTDPSWRELGPPERSGVTGRAMADAIGSMSALTIASIRGHCIGGGLVLASACDLRIASTTTTFRIPEVDLGVPLYWTGIPRLVRELGPALTKELVLTGRAFDATEAKAMRLVNTVVDDDDLDAATAALAGQLAD